MISKVLRIRYIMLHDLEFFWDIIEMWSFQLRCWSTITPRNLALFTRCTTSFRKITSFWGIRIFLRITSQPTTCDHINIKYIWGPHVNHMGSPCKPYGDPSLITHRDLQKVYTLNRYHFPIFNYYKETMKILVAHID